MLQLPYPVRAPAEPQRSAVLDRFQRLTERQIQRLRLAGHTHFEAVLWRAASLGLIASLLLVPHRFSPSSLAIGKAYMHRFWALSSVGQCVDLTLALIIWPVGIPLSALWFTASNGRAVKDRAGISRPRQFCSQLRLACTSGLMPPWYYIFELYRPGALNGARGYLTRAQTKHGAYRLLAQARGSASPLGDKEKFAHRCALYGVAAIPILCSIHDGELRGSVRRAEDIPRSDLFVKPIHGRGGKGAERWDYLGEGVYQLSGGEALSAAAWLDRLRRMSRSQPYLVQQRAQNHPKMRDLSNGALNTVRMISCLDEHEEPEIIGAVLRMAVGDNVTVDNVHAGGLATSIDIVTGRLGQATSLGIDAKQDWIDRHPATGAQITGRVLPLWNEVRDLAQKAHLAFGDRVVIGWDIAIMGDRPRVVEGNSSPDIDLVQRPLRTAFADGRLGELLAFHLSRCS